MKVIGMCSRQLDGCHTLILRLNTISGRTVETIYKPRRSHDKSVPWHLPTPAGTRHHPACYCKQAVQILQQLASITGSCIYDATELASHTSRYSLLPCRQHVINGNSRVFQPIIRVSLRTCAHASLLQPSHCCF